MDAIAICELWKQYGNSQLRAWGYCFWSYATAFLLIWRILLQVSHSPTVTFMDVAILFLVVLLFARYAPF